MPKKPAIAGFFVFCCSSLFFFVHHCSAISGDQKEDQINLVIIKEVIKTKGDFKGTDCLRNKNGKTNCNKTPIVN